MTLTPQLKCSSVFNSRNLRLLPDQAPLSRFLSHTLAISHRLYLKSPQGLSSGKNLSFLKLIHEGALKSQSHLNVSYKNCKLRVKVIFNQCLVVELTGNVSNS